jgi:hypothetical protein
MASLKKRRKQINLARRRQQVATGPLPHPDGDRRRRGSLTYEEGLAQKWAMQHFAGVIFPAGPEDDEANG